MRSRNLLILVAVVLLVGAYIVLFERHRPTSEEARQRADRVFPDLERDQVLGLDISNSHGSFRIERRGDGWQLVEPIDVPADSTAVSGLLGSLLNLSSERTLSADELDPAAYGLDRPPMRVVMTTADGEQHELRIGEETALGSKRAVSRADGEVILCPSWFTTDLDNDLDHWRDRDVVDILADQVASLTIDSGEDRVQIARSGEQWRLLEPLDDIADREHVRDLISDLNALRVEEFVDDTEAAADLGLDPPRARITVVRSDSAPPLTLELGTTREQHGSTQVFCRRDGHDLFWVDDRLRTALGRAPVRWRSGVVYPFDTWDVEGITLRSAGDSLELARVGGLWQLAAAGEADSSGVLDRLSSLAEMRATAYDLVEPGSGELGRVELVLGTPSDGAERPPPRLGFTFYAPLTAGGDAIVRVSERDAPMGVAAAAVDDVLADLDALRPVAGEEATGDDE